MPGFFKDMHRFLRILYYGYTGGYRRAGFTLPLETASPMQGNKPGSGSVLCEKNTGEQGEQSDQGMLSAEGEKSKIIVRIGKIRLLQHIKCAL